MTDKKKTTEGKLVTRKARFFPKAKTIEPMLSLMQTEPIMTERQIADAFGVHITSVRAWLSGKALAPRWTELAGAGLRNQQDQEVIVVARVKASDLELVQAMMSKFGYETTMVK